jgi:putative transposase
VSPPRRASKKSRKALARAEERAAAGWLVKAACVRRDDLTGPDGLLKAVTKQVNKEGLEEEMSKDVGYDL